MKKLILSLLFLAPALCQADFKLFGGVATYSEMSDRGNELPYYAASVFLQTHIVKFSDYVTLNAGINIPMQAVERIRPELSLCFDDTFGVYVSISEWKAFGFQITLFHKEF